LEVLQHDVIWQDVNLGMRSAFVNLKNA